MDMKKTVWLFLAVILMAAGLAGCSSSDDDDSGSGEDTSIPVIAESAVSSDIVAFFNTELPKMSGSLSPGFFVGSNQNVCRIINSKQELEKYYDGERELPAIDFNAYTLVVGQQLMSHSSCYAEKFTIRRGYNCVVLNLYVNSADSHFDVVTNMYYWGLCSKFYAKNVMVNIIQQN